ncbi:translesion DNA synthesis-associated protein ImuA [Pseudomonas sp. PH1b]|uniref:translesion DNA synthesis-associated protein ImuA n=1 Tax=Pseudomonas sp. PH1b TaxID=1397282 RepID=UPI00046ACB06|nr:translesion DNA synthesis-associated protein ImuA [Pseudomonas sp. PH1b]BFD42879.1 translesion DNA synthesis-associated protein ImuA [Pseudomonas sp. FFPRI_1]
MGAVVALDSLFNAGRVWKGRPAAPSVSPQPTGHAALDAALPSGGWPEAALSEILIAAEGVGELQLLWPTLARLAAAGERIVLVAPPYVPYPQAWQNAGVDVRQLSLIRAADRDALWAAEQCLRSGSCGAVLCWPQQADDRALRRLQVAAETGQTLAFAYRSQAEAVNPSPAALRIAVDARPAQLRVLKCRGGLAHSAPIAFSPGH